MPECPVCGMDVDATSPEETDYREESYAPATVEYEGELYAFCGEEHRAAFEENPEQYV
ncbi:YHS domain-containing protein [Halorussus amylolyticus]|uniref:YHS domain-containing protein n=1 Tax=Halorussus amylolyticus TaxID=1126242 RepID=UPI0010524235|nr:YHS domain-containing protein [Halorussus amylolyticus]